MSAGAKGPSIFKGRPGFGQVQLKLLARLLNFARELTGDHYKLGQTEAGSIPIEVRTLADLQQFESRIDRLALLGFDVYSKCRESLFEVRLNELRRRASIPFARYNRTDRQPEQEDDT